MNNFVLIHHHIFKNAGSTIDWILEKNFCDDFRTYDTEIPSGKVSPELLQGLLKKQQNLRAISSHHFHGETFSFDGYIFFDIIFLRHPIDRIRSIYDYFHFNELTAGMLAEKAQSMTLGEFVEYMLESCPHQINNTQVNILANQGRYCRPPNQYDLLTARKRIRNASVPGTLDMFDESLVVAEYFLAPAFGKLDWAYQKQNVSGSRNKDLESRLKEMKDACGTQIYEQLLKMNQLDINLLETAKKEVECRVQLVPDFKGKKTNFQERCITLVQ